MKMPRVLAALLVAFGLVTVTSLVALGNNSGTVSGTYLAQTTVAAGDTFTNSTTPTNLTSGYVLVANQFDRAGKFIDLRFGGTLSGAATPTTVNVEIMDATTVFWSAGATTLITNISNLTWEGTVRLTCITSGASGLVRAGGHGVFGSVIAGAPIMGATAIAGTGTIAFDTTVAHTFTARVTWGAAAAANTITQAWCYGILGN